MIVTATRSDLPQWARDNMVMTCPYCGCYIVDNSDTGVTTWRKCINPACPGHMSYKIAALADRFHIKGVGSKTAVSLIRNHKMCSHLEAIPLWFGENKPLVSLAQYVSMCELEGYGDTSAKQDLGEYSSPQDYFDNCKFPDKVLLANKQFLLDNAKYFQFKPGLSRNKLYCMATGSFHGYSDRQDFFDKINKVFGQYVNVIQVGKRKTNVHFLIREDDAVDHSKTATAIENHIPIVTPLTFLALLNKQFPEALKQKEVSTSADGRGSGNEEVLQGDVGTSM